MDQKEFEAALVQVEGRLKRLRALYDQWFMGIERVEPQGQRQEIERTLARLRAVHIRNTALRFRFTQFLQRYTTYSTYWKRVTRQIEEGTYKRDVLRARRLRGGADQPEAASRGPDRYELDPEEIDVDAALDAVMQSAPPPPAGKSSRPPPIPDGPPRPPRSITPFAMPRTPTPARAFPAPGAPGPVDAATVSKLPVPPPPPPRAPVRPRDNGISDDQLRGIYDRYVQARQKNAERTDNVKFETIAKSVRGMMPKLAQKHAGKKIDFEVVVKDGRVALKPVAKK